MPPSRTTRFEHGGAVARHGESQRCAVQPDGDPYFAQRLQQPGDQQGQLPGAAHMRTHVLFGARGLAGEDRVDDVQMLACRTLTLFAIQQAQERQAITRQVQGPQHLGQPLVAGHRDDAVMQRHIVLHVREFVVAYLARAREATQPFYADHTGWLKEQLFEPDGNIIEWRKLASAHVRGIQRPQHIDPPRRA